MNLPRRFLPSFTKANATRWHFALTALLLLFSANALSVQQVINGPPGSVRFGEKVVVLPNGNFVVADSNANADVGVDAGAVYLYRPDGRFLARLSGNAGDLVGTDIAVLRSGAYVVLSPGWNGGRGAVTWCNQELGCTGVVSAANSIVGAQPTDGVGDRVVELSQGNYVVITVGRLGDLSAATWARADGSTRVTVSSTNSLVGADPNNYVWEVVALNNGNYVVNLAGNSQNFVAWGNGASGSVGVMSSANSIDAGRNVASITQLSNSNYVLAAPFFSTGIANVGAVRLASGAGGTVGTTDASNALIGAVQNDKVGSRVVALSSGRYAIGSPSADIGGVIDSGAVSFAPSSGLVGIIGSSNSLSGNIANAGIGQQLVALSDGSYVAGSYDWSADSGILTWCNRDTGCIGVATPTSPATLAGAPGDRLGYSVTALQNGNYAVAIPGFDSNSVADVGAVRFCSSASCTNATSSANALIGVQSGDLNDGDVNIRVLRLSNGNYVIGAPRWNNGPQFDVGAVRFCSGATGCTGTLSAANALIGARAGDGVGERLEASFNGGYIVVSPSFDAASANNGAATSVGAAGLVGVVSAGNSLIGSAGLLTEFPRANADNSYLIRGSTTVSHARGSGSTVGAQSAENTITHSTSRAPAAFAPFRTVLAVGDFASNRVVLLRPGIPTITFDLSASLNSSTPNQVVRFAARARATPAPSNGALIVTANTGESCVSFSAVVIDSFNVEHSCNISFATGGARAMRAEFVGSPTFGYSQSLPLQHTVLVEEFKNGFE